MWYPILITVLAGYLLGNLNGSFAISILSHDDVRSHGSGNAGLTNFFRTFGGWKTALVALIDVGKTAVACLIGGLLLKPYGLCQQGQMIGAIAVSLGHDFPALLGFKGGKGILCGVTIAAIIDWRIALIIFVVFAICYAITKYVSLGSVAGALAYGISFGIFHWEQPFLAGGGIVLSLLALFMHRNNISRLIQGTESKVYLRKKERGK